MPLANKSSQTRIGSRGHITHLPGNILPRFGNLKVRIFQESFDGGPSDAVQTRDSNSVCSISLLLFNNSISLLLLQFYLVLTAYRTQATLTLAVCLLHLINMHTFHEGD